MTDIKLEQLQKELKRELQVYVDYKKENNDNNNEKYIKDLVKNIIEYGDYDVSINNTYLEYVDNRLTLRITSPLFTLKQMNRITENTNLNKGIVYINTELELVISFVYN